VWPEIQSSAAIAHFLLLLQFVYCWLWKAPSKHLLIKNARREEETINRWWALADFLRKQVEASSKCDEWLGELRSMIHRFVEASHD